jgi:hypothetical protein
MVRSAVLARLKRLWLAVTAPSPGGASADLLMTYRALRVGLVVTVVMMAYSVFHQIWRLEEFAVRGSISAYYYSPVRSVFVGALIAIGLALVAIRGSSTLEEVFLNVAGLFAPVVALVPTGPSTCAEPVLATETATVTAGQPLPRSMLDAAAAWSNNHFCVANGVDQAVSLPDWAVTNIRNNGLALLVAGLAALVVTISLAATREPTPVSKEAKRTWGGTILVYVVLLGLGFVVYETFDGRNGTAHFYAAGAMFGCFAVVALANGWKDGVTAGYRHLYRSIGGAMAFAAALFAVYRTGIEAWGWGAWGKEVFWLEVVEIALFGLFWIAQTIQLWPEPETM